MRTVIQRTFAGGEISPTLYSRVDTVKYQTGLRTLRNMQIMKQGGVQNRAGTVFVGATRYPGYAVRLIEFTFSATQTYVLEFGELYIRFIAQGNQVTESSKAITGISLGIATTITSAAHGYVAGDEVYVTGILGTTQLNGRNFVVANVTANTYDIGYYTGGPASYTAFNSSSYTAYASGGTTARVYTIASPYSATDLSALDFVQSADVMTIVHPSYRPYDLARAGETNWSISAITFAPTISAPTPSSINYTTTQAGYDYVITSIKAGTLDESYASAVLSTDIIAAERLPVVAYFGVVAIAWGAVTGAQGYNVYKATSGTGSSAYGFIGTTTGTTFYDNGISPNGLVTPPTAGTIDLTSANRRPSCVAYIQQRRTFGNSNTEPESIWMGRTGRYNNYSVSSPTQADDAITFRMVGRQINPVRHMVDIGKFLVLTQNGEWVVNGDTAGVITPTDVVPKQQSYNGSNGLKPLIIDNNLLYVQSKNSVVRDLLYDFQSDGYKGNDLTIFSSHLTNQFSLSDWAYQKVPHSIVWIARLDGVTLGLTYLREHQIWGWHRHDFENGLVTNVCTVGENVSSYDGAYAQDSLYLALSFGTGFNVPTYIVRMAPRNTGFSAQTDIFTDYTLSYNALTSTAATDCSIYGGTNYTYDELLTVSCSNSFFKSSHVGAELHFYTTDGNIVRFQITSYTSASVVQGHVVSTLPVAYRVTSVNNGYLALKTVTGLWHLEGKDVAVLADGFVVANPNNPAYAVLTVTNGSITLDRAFENIHVGLPYTSDLETLNIDTPQGESIIDKKKIVSSVTLSLQDTRGLFVGPKPPTDDDVDNLENLVELKPRTSENNYTETPSLQTDDVTINIKPEWNSNGRVFVRQIDPLPVTITGIAPHGNFPVRTG